RLRGALRKLRYEDAIPLIFQRHQRCWVNRKRESAQAYHDKKDAGHRPRPLRHPAHYRDVVTFDYFVASVEATEEPVELFVLVYGPQVQRALGRLERECIERADDRRRCDDQCELPEHL